MENVVLEALLARIPAARKNTKSGWVSFNGPCCVHNGQARPDTKRRSGILVDMDNRTSVSCFNCNFRTGWTPGQRLSAKFKKYFSWLGMPQEEINKVDFKTWQTRQSAIATGESPVLAPPASLRFGSRELPSGALPIRTWLEEGLDHPDFLEVLTYLTSRGEDLLGAADYHWTPVTTDNLNHRLIVPFKWRGEIVGWTGRIVNAKSSARYFSDVQPHYIFNTDALREDWRFMFITEGPMDGLAIHGVSMLGDKVTAEQAQWINQSGRIPVVVPDRVSQGGRLVDVALAQNWHVSFPRWDPGVKDAADAVNRYGRLYTIRSIIDAKTQNRLEINLRRQRLR